MATNRAVVRRMMGAREGFTDELSPKERAEMLARSRRVARARAKDKSADFLKAYGGPLAIGAVAVLALLYLKKREKEKAALVGSIMLHP
jgi:hypothetical protein